MKRQFKTVAPLLIALTGLGLASACSSSSTSSTTASSGTSSVASSGASSTAASASTATGSVAAPDLTTINQQVTQAFGPFPTVSGDTTRGVTANSINIAVEGDFTIGGAPEFTDVCQGVEARVNVANASHEIPQKINIVGCDDAGGDPNRATSLLQTDVLQKHIFAAIYMPVAPPAANILAQYHVPYFGWGINADYCGTQPYAFSDTGAVVCTIVQQTTHKNVEEPGIFTSLIKAAGLTSATARVAVFAENTSNGQDDVENTVGDLSADGIKPVFAEAFVPPPTSGGTPNYSPEVAAVLASKPNIITSDLTAATLAAFTQALRQAGYTGVIQQAVFVDSSVFGYGQLATAVNDTYGVGETGSPAFGGAAWNQITAAAKAVGVTAPGGLGFIHAYASTDLMITAIKDFEATGKPLTTENLTNFINAGWTYPGIGNVIAPVQFPLAHYINNPCTDLVKIDATSKQILPVSDLSCGPAILAG
jgi:Periplasmic binding protein